MASAESLEFRGSRLSEKLGEYFDDLSLIEEAFNFGRDSHNGQFRKDGRPYFTHCISVAENLAEVRADAETIIAALLHDTVEDTDVSLSDVEERFGKEVTVLVDGVTKLGKGQFIDEETLDVKIESLRKWFKIMQTDIRVAVIKLADRLHNMETLGGHGNVKKQQSIAKETLDIHVKIADKLGIRIWRRRLADLSLKYFDSKNYESLVDVRDGRTFVGKRLLDELNDSLSLVAEKVDIKDLIFDGHTVFDFYNFGVHKNSKILDIMPYRFYAVMPDVETCYEFLYFVHKLGRRKKSSFEDYINLPAVNGYQALHTTIVLPDGTHVKFKILTKEMYEHSQFGVTKYCFLENREEFFVPWLANMNKVISEGKDRSDLFWQGVQNDILDHSIAVYGPNDEVILIPRLSTALDAAYYFLGGDDASKLDRIFVDANEVSFDRRMSDGEKLSFEFSDEYTVGYGWLDYVDTKLGVSAVRTGLQRFGKDDPKEKGKELLQIYLSNNGQGFIEEIKDEYMSGLLKKYDLSSADELYEKIGSGVVPLKDIYEYLFKGRLKKTDNVKEKYLYLQSDSMEDAVDFLADLPNNLKDNLKCKMSPKKDYVTLKCSVHSMPMKDWDRLMVLVKRNNAVSVLDVKSQGEISKLFVLLVSLAVTWNIEPFMAKYVLSIDVAPVQLVSIRFWSLTVVFGLGVYLISRIKGEDKRVSLPLWNKDAFFLSFLLLMIAFSTYQGLQESYPSNYLMASIFYPVIHFVGILFKKGGKWAKLMMAACATVVVGLFFVFVVGADNGWSYMSRFWVLAAGLLFAVYSLIGGYVQDKQRILVRYNRMQLLLFFYCSVIMLVYSQFISWTNIGIKQIAAAVGFSLVFTGLPHLIYFYLIKSDYDRGKMASRIIMAYWFVLLFEMMIEPFVYQYVPSMWKLGGFVLMLIGLLIMRRSYYDARGLKEIEFL